jgi:hypothetical protein
LAACSDEGINFLEVEEFAMVAERTAEGIAARWIGSMGGGGLGMEQPVIECMLHAQLKYLLIKEDC